MLWKIALVLLFVWLLGVMGVYDVGELVHIPLFAGLMLLLICIHEGEGRGHSSGEGTAS